MSSDTPLPALSRCNSSCGSMALSTEVAFISCHRTSERAEDQARVAQTNLHNCSQQSFSNWQPCRCYTRAALKPNFLCQ